MQEPLLSPTSDYYNQQRGFAASQQSLAPSLPAIMYPNAEGYVSREAPTHRPQERSYSPSPTYSSSDAHYQQVPAQTPATSPYMHKQNPSQQYFQQYTQSQAQANPQPQYHVRQQSGNVLARQSQLTPAPSTPSQDPMQQYHGRQNSGNLLSGRGTSPAPPSAFNYPPTSSQQHLRQGSGNMLSGRGPSPSPSPEPYMHRQNPSQQYAQQQPSSRQANNFNMAGRGVYRG